MGVFRLGFLANRLSHPVISGFITASSILIATGQLKYLLGVAAGGHGLFEMALSLAARLGQVHWPTFVIGAAATGFLFWTCKGLKPALIALSVPARAAALLTRTGPVLLLALSILAVRWVDIDAGGVAAIGAVLGLGPYHPGNPKACSNASWNVSQSRIARQSIVTFLNNSQPFRAIVVSRTIMP